MYKRKEVEEQKEYYYVQLAGKVRKVKPEENGRYVILQNKENDE